MTRGIVQIGCGGVDVVTLYANSDAYPTGLGRNLLDFVSMNPVAELGANDYAMRLLNCDFGLEHDLDWGQNALDWVYRISIGKQGRVSLTAQEVPWGQNDERPQMERLLPPIDLAATIQKEDEEQLANEKHRQELMDSILPFRQAPHAPRHQLRVQDPRDRRLARRRGEEVAADETVIHPWLFAYSGRASVVRRALQRRLPAARRVRDREVRENA